MNRTSLHKDQHVLVVGAGKSGMAACRLLYSKGCEVCLTDGRKRSEQDPDDLDWLDKNNIAQEFGGHHLAIFLLVDLIVVSPGVPLTIPPLQEAQRHDVPIIGELELGYLYFAGDIIAITGTNGKTTVTTMIGECLKESGMSVFVGGNIGTPFCSHVLQDEQADIAVLEVSSFQLDSCLDFHPRVGLLLNISPDHLDRYESYNAYGDSKMRLFARQGKGDDVAILCGTDKEVMARRHMVAAAVMTFDTDEWVVDVEGNRLVWQRSGEVDEVYGLHDLQLCRPNIQNCMAAISGARLMGATGDAVQKVLRGFTIPLHRLTMLGSWGGVDYVNDSKATNVGAVQSALAGMDRPVILIAGGRDKGGDYGLLDFEVKRIVKTMILIGEAARKMELAFAGLTHICQAANMDDAVQQAAAQGCAGDTVLLSPGCASFDMYESYSDRGAHFLQAVQRQVVQNGSLDDSVMVEARQKVVSLCES